jgi:hypothetical protein
MSTLGQQAGAVEAAARIISGAAPTKPSQREKEWLLTLLRDAETTLRNAERR